MATKYLSQSDLTTLESRVATVFLKKADFNTAIADYDTSAQVSSKIAEAISGVTQFDYQIVESLPATGVKGVIYLIANSGAGTNIYDEYLWIGDKFELFGTQMVELIEYKGSATVTVTDGTGADAGKKVISVKYNTSTLTEDATNGLDLSAATKASLVLADSAVQGFTTSDGSVVVTGDGTTKDLAVSSTIQAGAAAGATALQGITSTGATITVTGEGTTKNVEIASGLVTLINNAVQEDDDNSIGAAVINNLWAD